MSASLKKLRAPEPVEAFLRQRFEENAQRMIDRQENVVIERLLKRSLEMRYVYAELLKKLSVPSVGGILPWQVVLDAVLSVAAQWDPMRTATAREGARKLKQINSEIAQAAATLATLVEKRADLGYQHGLYPGDDFDVVELIELGAAFSDTRRGALFASHVGSELHALRSRFDEKYWPTSDEVIGAIALVAIRSQITASNHITAAVLESRQDSTADFFRALLAYLENLARSGLMPRRFQLSDSALATIGTCALDLDPGAIAAENVNTLRQRLRRRAKRSYSSCKKSSE
jgi:hypothetical protein